MRRLWTITIGPFANVWNVTIEPFRNVTGTLFPLRNAIRSSATIRYPSATIHHPSATIHHPSATIHYPSATIHYPSATIHYPSATIHYPSATIHHPSATIHYPSATIHYPSAYIHYPSATIHYPSATIHHPSAYIHYPSATMHHPSDYSSAMGSIIVGISVRSEWVSCGNSSNTSIIFVYWFEHVCMCVWMSWYMCTSVHTYIHCICQTCEWMFFYDIQYYSNHAVINQCVQTYTWIYAHTKTDRQGVVCEWLLFNNIP
jgi:hypothetical protein